MPTATINVAAVTAPDQWALGAGTDKVQAVNTPNDEDSSYISSSAIGQIEQYSLLAAPATPPGSTITDLRTVIRAKKTAGTCRIRALGVLGGVTSWGHITGIITAVYVDYLDSLARPGGGAWTPADLAGLEVGIDQWTNAAARCTTFYLQVDYTPPPSTGDFLLLF